MSITANTRRKRAGRKQSSERIREVVTVLGSLSRTGDKVTISALARRLGMSLEEAFGLMSIICQASGEEAGGLLISANDDMTEFTLEYPGIHGRPIRLTTPETIALVHALDMAEIAPDDTLRKRLRTAFSSPGVNEEEVRKALGATVDPDSQATLQACAKSQAEQRMLTFMYKGLADSKPKERCAIIRRLRIEQSFWYADAYDLDRFANRIFRLDRMSDVSVGHRGRLPKDEESDVPQSQWIEVVFTDPAYTTLFEWPGLRITSRSNNEVRGTIPYYGERSDWLIRRMIACDGALRVDDSRIMKRVSEYICSLRTSM